MVICLSIWAMRPPSSSESAHDKATGSTGSPISPSISTTRFSGGLGHGNPPATLILSNIPRIVHRPGASSTIPPQNLQRHSLMTDYAWAVSRCGSLQQELDGCTGGVSEKCDLWNWFQLGGAVWPAPIRQPGPSSLRPRRNQPATSVRTFSACARPNRALAIRAKCPAIASGSTRCPNGIVIT